MTHFANFDEVRQAAGTSLGVSEWITIDQQSIDLFAQATGDDQWIHVDRERARNSPYGTTIAHGFLVVALIAPMVTELFEVASASMAVNYGLNKVRFPEAALSGTRVRGKIDLLSVEDVEGGIQSELKITIESDVKEKPVCVAQLLVRHYL
jgi:acyl dehydratase